MALSWSLYAEPVYPQHASSRLECVASWRRSPWWWHPGCRSRTPGVKIRSHLYRNSQYLVLENLLCHGVCPFYNWNVHVDDLELVWPENRMRKIFKYPFSPFYLKRRVQNIKELGQVLVVHVLCPIGVKLLQVHLEYRLTHHCCNAVP